MSISVDLQKSFGTFELDASFAVPAGVTALFGPSGSGKTTIAHALAGLVRADRACIEVAGTVLEDSASGLWLPPHRRGIGLVFQDARLFPHLTVRENLLYSRRFAKSHTLGAVAFDQIVEILGIEALLSRRTGVLSGGEAARVAIGRALLSQPRLLVLDEPLASLDAPRRADILPYLERLRDEVKIPMLYVSHAIDEVARLATNLIILDGGRVRRVGPTTDVLSDPDFAHVFGGRDVGALLNAKVLRHHDDGLTELSVSAGRLFLPKVDLAIGADLRLRIPAQDVILASARPEGLSALNILPCVVTRIDPGIGASALLQLRAGKDLILARITRRSVEVLGLRPGTECYAVVKSVAVAQAAELTGD